MPLRPYKLKALLCQINPAHTITFCVYKIHFNITSMVTIGLKRIKSNMFLNFIILGTLKSARKAHGFNSTCSFLRFYSPVDTLPSEYCKI